MLDTDTNKITISRDVRFIECDLNIQEKNLQEEEIIFLDEAEVYIKEEFEEE